MDAGGGSEDQDGRGDRLPPDEEQMRLGRARLARGGDPLDIQSGLSDGLIEAARLSRSIERIGTADGGSLGAVLWF